MVEKGETLTFVQFYYEGGKCDFCASRALGLWQTADHRAAHLCENHRVEMGAPEMTPGYLYVPTKTLLPNWTMKNGVPVKI